MRLVCRLDQGQSLPHRPRHHREDDVVVKLSATWVDTEFAPKSDAGSSASPAQHAALDWLAAREPGNAHAICRDPPYCGRFSALRGREDDEAGSTSGMVINFTDYQRRTSLMICSCSLRRGAAPAGCTAYPTRMTTCGSSAYRHGNGRGRSAASWLVPKRRMS